MLFIVFAAENWSTCLGRSMKFLFAICPHGNNAIGNIGRFSSLALKQVSVASV